jgi:pimeloyl-ACP methyl ester carboxylesterase
MERVQLNGADIEYDVRGSGEPVVFIHGAVLSDGFLPVIEHAGIAENFRIVHYRRRGYAGSSRAAAGMTMQGWAGDCIALLSHLGIAAANVAGHSFGAGIALQMAIDAPGRVRKLALLEPPLLSLAPSGRPFAEWAASVREIYDSGDKTAATDIVLAGAYGQDYRRFTDRALPAGAFDRAVSDIDTYFQVELEAMQRWNITTESLKDIRHPVLSMRGSDTLPVFSEGADLLQQWIPEIDTVSIPRASHDMPGRNPAAVATGLVEFFTKNEKNDSVLTPVHPVIGPAPNAGATMGGAASN